jgi:hypothetical protein
MRGKMTNLAHRSPIYCALAVALLSAASSSPLQGQSSLGRLRHDFANPPEDAKPMVRWWWFGVATDKAEILRELQQMKADGVGGAELAFEYPQVVDDPSQGLINQPFLSGPMLESVSYAQSEARKLGLRIDLTLGSGWPYGGPATPLAEAAGRLRFLELPVPPNTTRLPPYQLEEGESVISLSLVSGEPGHWNAATAEPLAPDQTNKISPAATSRTALVFIASHTRQMVKRAAVGSEGWVLDPFSRKAVETHLKSVGEPLLAAFGATPPYAIFSDSLEAYGADWTRELPAEFIKRRGYDLRPHLPELVSGGTAEAERVRHDWGKTLTELVDENYLTQINTWAIAHHTKFRSQTYGEPAVSLSSQRLVTLPEGEGPRWRAFSTLRWASSANHLFGNQVTSSETFTWLHSPVFRATPLDMKAEADLHFLIGVNQIICHGWPYSPPQAAEPGWSLYAAAVFNDHNPWHPVMPDVARYLQRTSFLLRQGEPANQLALLLPTDDAWAAFAPGKVTLTGEMARLISPTIISAVLSAGYNFDFIDADAIDRLGIHHPVLVIPSTDRIPKPTLQKIAQYAAAGGKVISVGRAPSSDAEGRSDAELTSLSHQLFDISRSTFVADESGLPAALKKAATPDLQLSGAEDEIGFVRRKLPDADIYFVANTSNHPVTARGTFSTAYKSGEQWDPDTGLALPGTLTPTGMPIELAPYGSAVYVFSDNPTSGPPRHPQTFEFADLGADLSKDWYVIFPSVRRSLKESTPTDWTSVPATRFYSGVAVYQRDFTLKTLPTAAVFLQVNGGAPMTESPNAHPGPGMRAWYDPPIREAAVVYINGHRAGALWHPPYSLELGQYLKRGENHIEIRVYNTAINAWAALPPHDYRPLIARYGDRFQMQDLDQVKPVPSGLLGSVHLVTEKPAK